MSAEANRALAHLVFFTLKEPSPERREALIASCQKYLTDHPGALHFSVGPRVEAYDRPINDTDFDVALVMLFASEADQERYQESDRHRQFLDDQLPHCSQVRVFDSYA